MHAHFPHRILTESLFCRNCRNVGDHGIFAREPFFPRSGTKKGVPLLCICDHCGTFFTAFSHEFVSIRTPAANHFHTKILGKNRLNPGDWLYMKGEPRPLKVKGLFHNAAEEIILLKDTDGSERKVKHPYQKIEEEESPRGYCLFPVQLAEALLGDFIYHVPRDQFGVVVGLIRDNGKDRTALLLNDDTLLFITLPVSAQYPEDGKLQHFFAEELGAHFPAEAAKLRILVRQGIIYLQGSVSSYAQKKNILHFLSEQKLLRGVVEFLTVEPPQNIPDSQIEKSVLLVLEDLSLPIFNYSYAVQNGNVDIHAFCYSETAEALLEKRLALIPGIRSFSLKLEEHHSASLHQKSLSMARILQEHPRLQGACIRVSGFDDSFLLEGFVTSIFQKRLAALMVFRHFKSLKLKNNLRVIP